MQPQNSSPMATLLFANNPLAFYSLILYHIMHCDIPSKLAFRYVVSVQ